MRSVSVLKWVCLCLVVGWIPLCISSPTGNPSNQQSLKHDETDSKDLTWNSSGEAEPQQEFLRISSLEGNENHKDNTEEEIPAETMDIAESRSIFTTLLSPFMNTRFRPGPRGPPRGREKITQGRRPPFPNKHFAPQPLRYGSSGHRNRLPNPTHQTHVFTPIHSSPVNNVHFPGFPQFHPGQIVVDVNSLPPSQIKYEEGSIPKPGDIFHVPIGSDDNEENDDLNVDGLKSHFSIIPAQPQISTHLLDHEPLPDPPAEVQEHNIFNQQPLRLREFPISTLANNRHQDPTPHEHGSNVGQNEQFAKTILPTNNENLQGFFSPNSANNVKEVADQFLTPFSSRPDSQEPYKIKNDDFFITGNLSEFTENAFELYPKNNLKHAQTVAPFFATFSTTTRFPFTLQTQSYQDPAQSKPITQIPQLQHTQPSFPENLRILPPNKPSSDFTTVTPLKTYSHFSVNNASPSHHELQRTTTSVRHESPKTSMPQVNLRTQQTRATTANHLAKHQQSWTLESQQQRTTPQPQQVQTTPKNQRLLIGPKNQQPRTSPPNQQLRTSPPNQQPRPTPNHIPKSPVPNQQLRINPAHQHTRTTSINPQSTTNQPSFQPQKQKTPQSQFKTTQSPTQASQITQAFHNFPKPSQTPQIRSSVTPASQESQSKSYIPHTTLLPKFKHGATTQANKFHSTVSLPQTSHSRIQTQAPNTETRTSETLALPQLNGERRNSQNQHQTIENDFKPIPGFTNDESGSFGFVPFGNSNEFFNHVFGGENPFGNKITTKAPATGSSLSPAQLVQTGKSLLHDDHTKFAGGFSHRPFKQEDTSNFSFQSLSPVTRPPRQTPSDINLSTAQPSLYSITSTYSFSSPSPIFSNTLPGSPTEFSSTLSSHQQNTNGNLFTTPVPITFSSSDISSQSFSSPSSGLSSGGSIFQRNVSYPQSINDLPTESSKSSQPEVHWGVQDFHEEQFAEHQLQENNSPFPTDLPERTIVPFTLSEAGENPYTTSQPFQSFQNSGSQFIISHEGAEAREENKFPTTISATTKIDDKEFEVLVLPYEDQKRNQEAIFSNFDASRDHISNDRSIEEQQKAGLVPVQPVEEEEVSVYLVRHRRPSTIAGGSPTPPTSFSPQQGDDSFGGLGQDAVEFPGFPVPVEFHVKNDETSTFASWPKDLLPSDSRASGRKLNFDYENLHSIDSPEVTTLPEEFQGTFDPDNFDPNTDFDGTKSGHIPIDFTGPSTVVSKYEEPDEYVKVLGLLAPPPGVVCDHGFCETEETRRQK